MIHLNMIGEEVIEVFPNPRRKPTSYKRRKAGSVKIIDIAGREMMQGQLEGGALDVSSLATVCTLFLFTMMKL